MTNYNETAKKYNTYKTNEESVPVDAYFFAEHKIIVEDNNPIQNPWVIDEFIGECEEEENLCYHHSNPYYPLSSKEEGAQ